MAVDFKLPKLGDNVEEATIVDWLVEDGAEIEEGDEIVEVETDKAVVPVPANASGVLRIGSYGAGDTVKISETIATIEAGDGDEPPTEETSTETAEEEAEPAESTETAEATEATEPAEPAAESRQTEAGEPAKASKSEDKVRVTPVAEKMAADMGVDLQSVNGSGELGKITKEDVLHAASGEKAPAEPKTEPKPEPKPEPEPAKTEAKAEAKVEPKPSPATPPAPPTPEEDILKRTPLKGIRAVIARRMGESTQTTSRVTLMTEVDATEFVKLREQLKSRYAEEWGFSPGYNDLLVMIVANALSQFPYMNARFSADGQSIEQLKPIHMGMAVDTERGLLVTVLKDADKKGLQQIGSGFRELVKKARSGKAGPDELSGSTFTISSLGIFRVDAFTPVINLPEAAILGVGRIKEKPVVKDGEIVARQMITLSLVFDHRLVDGAPAARFLDHICDIIEEPYLLFLTRT